MKCIVVDDEPLAVEGMKLNISEVPSLELVASFHNALDANAYLKDNPVDLMFLDINMPGLSGLDFIRSLRNPPLTILTTAYQQFALEGFELNVLDYLVKPVRMHRFLQAVHKAEEVYQLKKGAAAAGKSDSDSIYIRADRKYVRLNLREIVFIKGLKDYVVLHTPDARYTTAMNLKTIHAQLPQDRFARISKSHLVNVAHVQAFDSDFVYVEGENLPIGKAFAKEFKANYIDKDLIERK